MYKSPLLFLIWAPPFIIQLFKIPYEAGHITPGCMSCNLRYGINDKFVFFFLSVNVGEDCPVFDGLFEFCQLSTGGSIGKWHSLFQWN